VNANYKAMSILSIYISFSTEQQSQRWTSLDGLHCCCWWWRWW